MGFTDKQLKIINTAEVLFSRRGYDGTSVRDIAEASDVNVAMISYYFGSKEKLMQSVFLCRSESLSTKIDALLNDDSLDPFQKLEIILEDYVDRVIDKHRFYKLMLTQDSMTNNEPIQDMIREMKSRNATLMMKLLEDGQKKGVFRNDIDVLLLINSAFGTAMHTFIGLDFYKEFNHLQTESPEELDELVKQRLKTHIKRMCKAIVSI